MKPEHTRPAPPGTGGSVPFCPFAEAAKGAGVARLSVQAADAREGGDLPPDAQSPNGSFAKTFPRLGLEKPFHGSRRWLHRVSRGTAAVEAFFRMPVMGLSPAS